jgi:serine/threonine protein kinase/tetratricopeptide (TPR) repeat protein
MARLVFGSVQPLPHPQGEIPVTDQKSTAEPVQTVVLEPQLDLTGQRIGRYKLLERIGEGGFGEVYMAEQMEPVQRKVAFKIIKAGMDSRQIIARFEAEQQALALMDHPNIAKVFDAGTAETGRPYFVMELVRGISITSYCDQKRLSTADRLKLFIEVCHAVQHAHQKGIIHRDIKPSNVLVTLHDGKAVPKVIDFGISKALGQKLTDKTIFTGFAQLIGTPAYMSPEQAELSGLDMDTRSDIYSLGVLLYELLTGVTPFDKETMAKAGLDEIRRMIRETDPPRPSTRVETMGAKATEIAKDRHTEPEVLRKLVRGDLDWIVMKCLEKDRTRRYETTNGLASDIQHHLSNEPVVARPPSTVYRLEKLVRRNKVAVTATGAIAAAIIFGLVLSVYGLGNAERQRLRAETNEKSAQAEAAKSQQVARILRDMLKGVGPSVALGRDTGLLREILDETADHFASDLQQQPAVEAELCYTIGATYYDIGEYEKAESMHRRGLELRELAFGRTNVLVADSLCSLGEVLAARGDETNAEPMQREALHIRRSLLGNNHPDVVASLKALADTILGPHANNPRLGEAEELDREALALAQKIYTNDHPTVASSMSSLGNVLWRKGEGADTEVLNEAEKLLRGALEMQKRLFGDFHPSVASTASMLGNVLRAEGQAAEAELILRESLANRQKLLGDDHPALISSVDRVAALMSSQGRFSDAEPMYRQELAIRRKRDGSTNGAVVTTLNLLGIAIRRQGRVAEAEPLFREALEITKSLSETTNNEDISMGKMILASALIEQGKAVEEAEGLLREGLPFMEEKFPDQWVTFWGQHLLGCSLMLQKRYVEAEPLLTSGYLGIKERSERIGAPYLADVAAARSWVSKFYEETGWADKAAEWKRKLAEQERVYFRKELERHRKAADREGTNPSDRLAWKLPWMLATGPYPEMRSGSNAVRYAEKVAARSNGKDPWVLRALAAAYAENGDFDRAVSAEQQVMDLLKEGSAYRGSVRRLELYRAGKPYHLPEEGE